MNIYSRLGDKVIFDHPDAGYTYDQNKAKEYLKIGAIYTVDKTIVHSYSSEVFLLEFKNVSFNTVLFSDVRISYEELLKKFKSLYFPNNEFVITKDIELKEQLKIFIKLEKDFDHYLYINKWSYYEFLTEMANRFSD